jgi:hypothetical protein
VTRGGLLLHLIAPYVFAGNRRTLLPFRDAGEATLAGEDVREYRIPFEESTQHLWGRLLEDLRSKRPMPTS